MATSFLLGVANGYAVFGVARNYGAPAAATYWVISSVAIGFICVSFGAP